MQERYFKDLGILLCVIIIFILAFRAYYTLNEARKIPKESQYANMKLSDELLAKIQQIDESISERKEFRFRVTRDPLKQDLIVQTRLDLLAEWEAMVRRTPRLSAIYDDHEGNRVADIDYDGKMNTVKAGDVIANRRVTRIDTTEKKLYYVENGVSGQMVESKVPPKPAAIATPTATAKNEYNW